MSLHVGGPCAGEQRSRRQAFDETGRQSDSAFVRSDPGLRAKCGQQSVEHPRHLREQLVVVLNRLAKSRRDPDDSGGLRDRNTAHVEEVDERTRSA